MKINLEIFDQLKDISQYSTYQKTVVSAALVHKNKVVSFGVNQDKTHPYQLKFGKNNHSIYWHAETNALYNADRRIGFNKFKNSTLYVARYKWDCTDKNKLVYGLSMPCEGCMRCIKEYGIKNVIYTLDHIEGTKDNYGVMIL